MREKIILVLILLKSTFILSQTVAFDPTFGNSGKTHTGFGVTNAKKIIDNNLKFSKTCPPNIIELNNLINKKNKIVKQLNNIYKAINVIFLLVFNSNLFIY